MELQKRIDQLLSEQRVEWLHLDSAMKQSSNNKVKQFDWGDNNNVTIKYNPNIPTYLTEKDIIDASCVLCEGNRPKGQKGLEFTNKYIILPNQYPIIENHLIIALHSHVLQRIRKKIGDMLTLAQELPNYIITYDGASSYPTTKAEHFHFQAGLKTETLLQGDNELRTCLVIESESISEAEENFEDVYYYLNSRQPDLQEPVMNIIAFIEDNKYIIHIFPRKIASNTQFNMGAKGNIISTPTAIEMAGLITLSNQEDYDKIKKEDIEDIYYQVSMSII